MRRTQVLRMVMQEYANALTHVPYNADGNPDYEKPFGEAEGMTREQVTQRAGQAYAGANQARAGYERADGNRAAAVGPAVEQALAWTCISGYLERTGRPRFEMDAYRAWALHPWRVWQRYRRILSPAEHDRASNLRYGMEPADFRRPG